MNSRGEDSFIKLPSIGAKMYDLLSRTKGVENQFKEIALDLTSKVDQGCLLDIGTGPGKLLGAIHGLNPAIELFGLDISKSMIKQARKNTVGIDVNFNVGSIEKTMYESDFFDLVTCTGSFYLWNRPVDCLNEVYRILKAGKSAYLYETYRDYDKYEFITALNENLKEENFLKRKIAPYYLKRQLKMTYLIDEIKEIITQTDFKDEYRLDQITLARLPVWVRIRLTKS
ncbi:MAG: class I SAM-dependent methyltransferase [Candidatus Odinarchaeota archaeon]